MPMMPIGILIQKIQCQLRYVVRNPPISGPVTGATRAGTVSHAMAETSSLRGVERTSSRRPTGVIIDEPMPWKKRESTKVSSEKAKEQASDPSMNTKIASLKMFLAPNRSAIQPLSGIKMASATK